MIELKCCKCGKDCDLQPRVIDVHVISNPNPVNFEDTGAVKLTDDPTLFGRCFAGAAMISGV